jgi:hypothetical protein
MALKEKPSGGPSPGPDGAFLVKEWDGDVKDFLLAARNVKRKT